VDVLFAAGASDLGGQIVNPVGASVEKLDEDEDAVVRQAVGVAELLDLGVGEGVPLALGAEMRRDAEKEADGEQKAVHGSILVGKDLGKEFVVDVVELLEGGL
jgi:hypothetical protein